MLIMIIFSLTIRAIELIMEKDIVQGTLLERMPQKQCTVLHYACVQMNFKVGQFKKFKRELFL